MLKKIFSLLLDSNEKAIKQVQPLIPEIRKNSKDFQKLNSKDIKERVQILRDKIKPLVNAVPYDKRTSLKTINKEKGLDKDEKAIQEKLYSFIPEFFALVNEIYRRKIGIEYFDVQLIAGIILSQGQKLTELKTGEGKTMVFQLPAFLYALTGRGSHVITVNDYLAKVGGEYAGHIASELGLSIGIITAQGNYKFISDSEVKKIKGEDVYKEMKDLFSKNGGIKLSNMRGYNLIECDKREAYSSDVVYGTNNEFGFDYLRNNMAKSLKDIKQQELYFAIIDEADSILIDEARTPLIISAPASMSNELYVRFAKAVRNLKNEEDYTVDEKAHSAVLTESGIKRMEKILGVDNIWEDYQLAHHLDNALKAMTLYKKDIDYLVRGGEVLIVDQFTGRVLPGRRYSEGLHQAIEAKEGVEIKKESQTLATITFQNFFRIYKIISGGSGTIMTEAEEFYRIYHLDSVEIPTNKPVIRKDHNDRVYKNREAKFKAVVKEIKERHKTGQPILVGTTSIEDSEYLSKLVKRAGIKHEVLNAKYHEREAQIVAKAGEKGAVTIATNMAGRGTDIPLGKGVKELGGLYVIGTQRHEARRIDNQLRGRSGRQGDPGESRFFISLDDDIMRIQGGAIVQKIMNLTNIPDDMPIETKLIGKTISNAQKKMENMHFDSRKQVVEYDDVVNQQREIFYTKRFSILEKCDNAQGIFLHYPNIVTKDLNDPIVQKKQKEVEGDIKNLLFDELNRMINLHFIKERKDEIDLEKLLSDFLNLAKDELILEAMKNLKITNEDNVEKLKSILIKELQNKNRTEIEEYLQTILRELHSIKKQQFADGYYEIVKIIQLENMDRLWTQHLETMQDLREGIGLRGYAQRDPLVEYKNEGYRHFEILMENIFAETAKRILKISSNVIQAYNNLRIQMHTNTNEIDDINEGTREILTSINNVINRKKESKKPKPSTNKTKIKIGRNDPCWCGSGKKFKKCHGKTV